MADSTGAGAASPVDSTAQQEAAPPASAAAVDPTVEAAASAPGASPAVEVAPSSATAPPRKPKAKAKKRRLPRGRRAEDESDEEAGGARDAAAGDDDASDLSSEESDLSSGSESDEEDEGEPSAQDTKAEGKAAAIPAPAANTAWADVTDAFDGGEDASAPVVSFDDLARNGLSAVTTAGGPAGKAGKQPAKAQADGEVDPIKAAKALEKRQRQKEKRKAKAVARKQQAQAGAGDASAPTGADEDQPKASTSKVEPPADAEEASSTPAPPSSSQPNQPPSRVSNRQAYLAKISSDPSFVPRVGRFWTHDERHYAAGKFGQGDSEYSGLREMSDYWRGRGFRGRARGFPARGVPGFRGRGGMPFPQQQQQHQQPPHQAADANASAGPAESAETVASPPPAEDNTTANGSAPDGPVKVSVPTFGKGKWGAADKSDADKDWNHDGYLALMQDEERRSARGRGRGRGQARGMAIRGRGGARGGVPFIHPAHAQGQQQQQQQQQEDASQVVVRLPQSATTSEELSVPPTNEESASATPAPAVEPAATTASTPAIPAEAAQPATSSVPPEPDTAPVKTPTSADISSLQLQAEYAALRQQQELVRQKELRLQEDMRRLELEQQRMRGLPTYAGGPGSEAGSIGSGSQSMGAQQGTPAQAQANMLPPGVGMAENGSFFDMATGQPVVFVPTPSPGPSGPINGYQGNRPYYPPQQAYYPPGPGSMTPEYAQPRQIQHRNSQSGSFYPPAPSFTSQSSLGGRESPFPPPQAGPGGYFALPRQNSRIQIRAPSGASEELAGSVLKNKSGERKQSGGVVGGASPYRADMPVNGAVPYQDYGYGAGAQVNGAQGYYPPVGQQYPGQGQQYPAGAYGGDYGYQQQYGAY